MSAEAFPLVTASGPPVRDRRRGWPWLWLVLLGATFGSTAYAQTCQTATDMDASARTALETTAKRYFEVSAHGDVAVLKQNSIPAAASSFAGIEAAVKENQAAFTGANATVRPPFFVIVDGSEPPARPEFLCRVVG